MFGDDGFFSGWDANKIADLGLKSLSDIKDAKASEAKIKEADARKYEAATQQTAANMSASLPISKNLMIGSGIALGVLLLMLTGGRHGTLRR